MASTMAHQVKNPPVMQETQEVHPPHYNWLKHIPSYNLVIFHCVYAPQLPYLFIRWWTSRWLPRPRYCNGAAMNNEVGESRAYYTRWSKSERERQIPYIYAHIWNLEKWHSWSYMQGSKGDTDIKNRILGSEGEVEIIWENSIETYIYHI